MIIKKNKKNKPPIHCEDDLQSIKVGSKYLIFLKIEKPVPVKPDIDSKIEFKKEISVATLIDNSHHIGHKRVATMQQQQKSMTSRYHDDSLF